MIEVELSNGEVVNFPDSMTDAEIEADLRKRFPPPRPSSLAPGEAHTRPNGASVNLSAMMNRYVVQDSQGKAYGLRQTLDAAIDLADSIQPPPPPRRKAEPKPEKPIDPELAEKQIAADVEAHIRRSREQARRAQRFDIIQRRSRNRGTLG